MSEIKQAFVSRFKNGVLLESDFSQLEVVGLAALSHDPVLIQDLLDGRDMHTYYTIERFAKRGIKLTPDTLPPGERFRTKRMTFQLQYGSGAPNMARKMGMNQEDCQAFIDAYYTRYSRVKEWQEEVYEAVKRSRKPSERHGKTGLPLGTGVYESASGRLYTFHETDPPDWMVRHHPDAKPNFNPPQVKNYPVQGFATGDIMALFRARVYRWWLTWEKRNKALPNNTVHDSIMFDCYNMAIAKEVAGHMARIAGTLIDEVKLLWDIDCPVPFKIESKAGPNWGDMRKI